MSNSQFKHARKKSWTIDNRTAPVSYAPKKEKFNFEVMKATATSDDPVVRKAAFVEYFERFNEFPSFLFENEQNIDVRLATTIQDLSSDKNSSKELLAGIAMLMQRLSS